MYITRLIKARNVERIEQEYVYRIGVLLAGR
jgi:hypothetical protein